MTEAVKVRPFLIGIVDGGLTNEIIKQLEKYLEGYPICTVSMSNYYKDIPEEDSFGEVNYIRPDIIDFELLLSHLEKMRDRETCDTPIYDFKKKLRSKEIKKIESCQIIILEGLFCFYDHRICNLMDLKIFIDTDNDIRLARTISQEIESGKSDLLSIITKFHKNIKPAYNTFISSTKRHADIILPNATGHETAVKIITNYLKLLLDKVTNNKTGSIFSFLNEIIEPKFQFFQDNLIVNNDKLVIQFLKDVFEDFITNNQDEEFIEIIRQKLLNMLQSSLVEHFRKNPKYEVNLPKLHKLIFDTDDISNEDFEKCKSVVFFKTAILTENDIKIPQYILNKNKDCNIIICSIFLAPKFAHFLTSNQMNNILFVTLYFSEFFVKYDEVIKKDKNVFNEKELEKLFKKLVETSFS